MPLKPLFCQLSDPAQRPRFLKQMSGARHDLKTSLRPRWKLSNRGTIQFHNGVIVSSNDEQTGRKHPGQCQPCEIRPTSPRHDCPHDVRASGCCAKGRCCTRAGSEVTKPRPSKMFLFADPIGNRNQSAHQ